MNARWLLLPLVLLSALSRGDSVILLSPEAASRVIAPEAYDHDLWIQWPSSTNPAGSNRLWSLSTGLDWCTSAEDLAFNKVGGRILPGNLDQLHEAGYFIARSKQLAGQATVVVRDPRGFVAAESAFLGMAGPEGVNPLDFDAIPPSGCMAIYSAASWDDAAAVRRRAGGRCLVLEYPPPAGRLVSAAWKFGKGFPAGLPRPNSTGVTGLVLAKEVIPLLQNPALFPWDHGAGPEDSTAEESEKIIEWYRPWHLISAFVVAFLSALGALASIGLQKGSFLARIGLVAGVLPLPALLLAARLPMSLLLWPLVSAAALCIVLAPLQLGFRIAWPKSHPLLPVCLLVVAVTAWSDPKWSVLSNVFSPRPLPVSPLAVGLLVAASTGTVALSLSGGLATRIVAALVLLGLMAQALLAPSWWIEHSRYLMAVPLLAVLAGTGSMRAYWLPFFAMIPLAYIPWNGRFAVNPGGFISRLSDHTAINLADHTEFLVSPAFLSTLLAVGLALLLSGRFLRHQLRRGLLAHPAARSLAWSSLATASMGLAQPVLLASALVILQAGILVLLFDTAGSP